MRNPISFLKIVSIVLLSFGQVIAIGGEVRSQVPIQQPLTQEQIINRLIEELKTEELPGEALEAHSNNWATNPKAIHHAIAI